MTTPTYDTDFYAWTQAQADAIRAKDLARLDIEHLAEEIESLGISGRARHRPSAATPAAPLVEVAVSADASWRAAGAAASTRPVMPSPIGSPAAPACRAIQPSASSWPIGALDAMR